MSLMVFIIFIPHFVKVKLFKFPKDKIKDHVIIKGYVHGDLGTHIIEEIYIMVEQR